MAIGIRYISSFHRPNDLGKLNEFVINSIALIDLIAKAQMTFMIYTLGLGTDRTFIFNNSFECVRVRLFACLYIWFDAVRKLVAVTYICVLQCVCVWNMFVRWFVYFSAMYIQ